jgi:hypothetical protein
MANKTATTLQGPGNPHADLATTGKTVNFLHGNRGGTSGNITIKGGKSK